MKDLRTLLTQGNIVEAYSQTYSLPKRLRHPIFFLEEKWSFKGEDQPVEDLLDKMVMEAEASLEECHIVERYRHDRNPIQEDPKKLAKLLASSSSQVQVSDKHDSSMEIEKPQEKNGYDTDNMSERSDFSRKESFQEMAAQNVELIQQTADNQMEIESAKEEEPMKQIQQQEQSTPTKTRPERNATKSAKKQQSRIQKIAQVRSVGCNCKKSHCLKMYCQCFHMQIFCGENCSCKGCGNMERSNEQQQAIIQALARNPKAFDDDNPEKGCFDLGVDLQEVKKGCKCKKTKCQKKYCQCYNSGLKCSVFCKCQGCENID